MSRFEAAIRGSVIISIVVIVLVSLVLFTSKVFIPFVELNPIKGSVIVALLVSCVIGSLLGQVFYECKVREYRNHILEDKWRLETARRRAQILIDEA